MSKSVKILLTVGAASLVVLIVCLSLLLGRTKITPTSWQEQYDLGIRYLSEGNYEEAIIAFTTAIEIDPKQSLPYIGRGDAYIGSGENAQNLTAAQADYEAAIELDETNAAAWLGLADVYIRCGDYDKAWEVLQEALEKTDKDSAIADKIAEMESVSQMPGDEENIFGRLRKAKGGEVVTLTKDSKVEITEYIDIYGGSEDNPIILDLNGHTLAATRLYRITVYGALQIRDNSDSGNGALDLVDTNGIKVDSSGHLFFDGGTIILEREEDESNSTREGISAIALYGNFTMNNGTIMGAIIPHDNAIFTMNDGTINGSVDLWGSSIFNMNSGIINGKSGRVGPNEKSTFIMKGGTIIAGPKNGGVPVFKNATFVMDGGSINGPVNLFDNTLFTMNNGIIVGEVNSYEGATFDKRSGEIIFSLE